MPTPDQYASPFRAAGSLPLDRRYGGKITAYDQLPIHALGDQYVVEGNGTVTSLPSLPIGETVMFQILGTPTFTNSAKLICPGNQNYTATVGDFVIARSQGDGIWQLYVHSNAAPAPSSPVSASHNISVKGAEIASAATINLQNATGNYVHVTGAATISAITLSSD